MSSSSIFTIAAFGVFETIGHQDDPPVEEANPWKTLEDQPGPEVGQVVQTHRLTVKECQEALIIALLETQGTDHAGHAHEVSAYNEPSKYTGEPKERSGTVKGWF